MARLTPKFGPHIFAWRCGIGQGLACRFFFTVVGWTQQKIVRLMLKAVDEPIRPKIVPGARLHCQVNIGAESYEELFFTNWEPE